MDKDLTKKRCLSDNERYADLLNGHVFHGKQIVKATDLADMDSQTGMWSDIRTWGKKRNQQKYRDLIRKVAFGVNFAVIGIESQEEAHYLMPLRSMAYDVAEYERQASIISKKVHNEKGLSNSEFLSGFKKNSRLMPCITLVLYFGNNWDGSRDLHGLLDFTDIPEELKALINNYQIHLLEVRKLENTDVFRTDLKQIFDIIRFSDDKEKLNELVKSEIAYQEMEEDAFDMASAYVEADELIAVKEKYEKDGKVNMCKALQELIEEGRNEGRNEGRTEGENRKIIEQVCKKLIKGKTPEIIAEELEEEPESIRSICKAAASYAPDYDCDKVYDAWQKKD